MTTDRQQKAEAIAEFEERAAIIEHDGDMERADAELTAERQLGGRPVWRGSILKVIDTCGAQVPDARAVPDA